MVWEQRHLGCHEAYSRFRWLQAKLYKQLAMRQWKHKYKSLEKIRSSCGCRNVENLLLAFGISNGIRKYRNGSFKVCKNMQSSVISLNTCMYQCNKQPTNQTNQCMEYKYEYHRVSSWETYCRWRDRDLNWILTSTKACFQYSLSFVFYYSRFHALFPFCIFLQLIVICLQLCSRTILYHSFKLVHGNVIFHSLQFDIMPRHYLVHQIPAYILHSALYSCCVLL